MATVTERLPAARSETFSARVSRMAARGPLNIFLILIALAWLTPTIGMLIASFRPVETYRDSGWWTAFSSPNELILDNYTTLLDKPGITEALVNTVKISIPSSLLVVVIAALAAYAFAWVDFRGREPLFVGVVALLVVPLQMALIPAARLFDAANIFGTVWAAIVFHIAFGLPFAILLLRNFFIGIPGDLLEAARMDGASEWQIFTRLMLPLGMPAIASLLIFQFLWTWNDLLVAASFAGDSLPMTVLLRQQMRTYGTSIDVIAPGAFLLMSIPLIVFFAFQRYFVQGLLAGSVK